MFVKTCLDLSDSMNNNRAVSVPPASLLPRDRTRVAVISINIRFSDT